jgi:hypothetical protein
MRNDKAILINARTNTISFVSIKDYKDISKFGNFDIFTTVQMDAKGNTLYVDDEGLINGTTLGFTIEGYDQPLMGNGIILGTNLRTGDSKDTDLTLEKVASMVRCFARAGRMLVRSGDNPKISV